MFHTSITRSKMVSFASGAILGFLWLPLNALMMVYPIVPAELLVSYFWLGLVLEFASYVVAMSALALIAALGAKRWISLKPAFFLVGYFVIGFAQYLCTVEIREIALVAQEPLLWVYPVGILVSAIAITFCWSLAKTRET